MNQSEDWDTIWRWQWFRRSLWLPYFRDVSHPEGRPARTAPIWNSILRQNNVRRVLDCNCGLGLRAILLKEAGFDVVGTDSSAVAIECAKEIAASRNMDIPFFQSSWQGLGEIFTTEFDAIINDAFAWTITRPDLRFSAFNFGSILNPGGVLIFTGADEWSNPADMPNQIELAWQSAPRFQLRNEYENAGTRLTMLVARDKTEVGVVENYLFVVKESGGTRLETATICNSLQWTWPDYQTVFREAGFSDVQSVKIPAGRREHVLNVARK